MSAVIFDSTRKIKTRRRFAAGVLPGEAHREPYTAEDLAWAAEALSADSGCYVVTGWGTAAMEDRAEQARWDGQFAAEVRRGTPVRLDDAEEAARYGLRTPETLAEHAATWAAYQRRAADVRRWVG